jgi:hypothetical protein
MLIYAYRCLSIPMDYVCAGISVSDVQPRDVLDLIATLNGTDPASAGFQYTTGPNPHTPAILLESEYFTLDYFSLV